MASPQLENGYTKIANEILEALAQINLSSYQWRCVLFLIRKTYGFSRKSDQIALSQWTSGTGIKKPHVCRTLKELQQKRIITNSGNRWGFNKHHNQWNVLPKQAKGGDWRTEDNWHSVSLDNIKLKILQRDENECCLCGANQRLEIHHIDYNQTNWEELNLVTLCRFCHAKTNSKTQQYWITLLGNITYSCNLPLPIQAHTKETTTKETKLYTPKFETFWGAYPKKVGKGYAFQCWKKILSPKPTLEEILQSIDSHRQSLQWKKDGGQYIPNPSTWLNQRRWEDEVPVYAQPTGRVTHTRECRKCRSGWHGMELTVDNLCERCAR
jgi:phage replication O-like protein O